MVLRDVLGWGLSRGILGRRLKYRASQVPSFGAHVLPAFLERFGEGIDLVVSKGCKQSLHQPRFM